MAFVEFPNTVQANLRSTMFGQNFENVLTFEKTTGAFTQAEVELMAEDLSTWVLAELVPEVVTDLTFTEWYIVDLSNQNGWVVEYTINEPGTIAVDPLPPQDAICISFLTNSRGRSFRGRTYLPGISKNSVDNGLVIAGVQTSLFGAYNSLNGYLASYDTIHVVPSRISNGVERTTGVTTPVTNYRVNPAVATQRRRRIGVGQ